MFESFLGINFLNLYDTDAFLAIQLILTLMINCAIFKRMTDIRISWTVFLTLALLDVVIQYNITNMIMVFEVFILMILAFLAKGLSLQRGPGPHLFGNKTYELNYFLDHELSTRHCPRRSLEQLINPPHRYELGI